MAGTTNKLPRVPKQTPRNNSKKIPGQTLKERMYLGPNSVKKSVWESDWI